MTRSPKQPTSGVDEKAFASAAAEVANFRSREGVHFSWEQFRVFLHAYEAAKQPTAAPSEVPVNDDPNPSVWNWKNTNDGGKWGTPRKPQLAQPTDAHEHLRAVKEAMDLCHRWTEAPDARAKSQAALTTHIPALEQALAGSARERNTSREHSSEEEQVGGASLIGSGSSILPASANERGNEIPAATNTESCYLRQMRQAKEDVALMGGLYPHEQIAHARKREAHIADLESRLKREAASLTEEEKREAVEMMHRAILAAAKLSFGRKVATAALTALLECFEIRRKS